MLTMLASTSGGPTIPFLSTRMRIKKTGKLVRISTICVAVYLMCFGVAMAFFPLRPFWNDEWRLIYNIKFKTIPELWGVLDLLQECPRVYLTLLKLVSEPFDYSYISLRLPPLIIGFASVLLVFWLRKKVFPSNAVYSYLFILILISSQTFTDYLVQVKHYQMDLFLCLVALWQVITMLKISKEGLGSRYKYLLLCSTFLVVPYFSYIYPITIAPLFPIIFISTIAQRKNELAASRRSLWYLFLPLAIVTISIGIFYLIDVKNVMADERMYQSYIKMSGGREPFIEDFWKLFALVGSGLVFEIIFGVLGIVSFFYTIFRLVKSNLNMLTIRNYLELYAVFLVLLVLFFLLTDKIHGGVARLTAFTVPSIAIMIILLLKDLKEKHNYRRVANVTGCVLFLGLFGNIISTCINTFTHSEYSTRINTYWQTSKALQQARRDKIPIMTTDEVYGLQYDINPPAPGQISTNNITPAQIAGVDTVAAEVIIRVNPEYKVWDSVPIYLMPDAKWTKEYVQQLPEEFDAVIVGDGIHFSKQHR